MRKWTLFLIMFFIAAPLIAHPASSISMDFNPASKELTVVINHTVRDNQKHYIDDVVILINDKEAVKQILRSQTDNTTQKVSYIIIDAKNGDEIRVKTDCNMGGSLSKKLLLKDKSVTK